MIIFIIDKEETHSKMHVKRIEFKVTDVTDITTVEYPKLGTFKGQT